MHTCCIRSLSHSKELKEATGVMSLCMVIVNTGCSVIEAEVILIRHGWFIFLSHSKDVPE